MGNIFPRLRISNHRNYISIVVYICHWKIGTVAKQIIINSLASRYEVLPKEIKAKIPYAYFIKYPQRVELAVLTTEYVLLGRKEIFIKMRKGERIAVWKCKRVV